MSYTGSWEPLVKQFPFQIPYNLDHFFHFSIAFSKFSFLPFQFPYPSIFATCYPFPEIFTSFPFPPNCANSPFYPSVRSSSPTYFTSTFISNSADGLLSGEVLCDALRFGLMCMCPPIPLSTPMVSRYNLRTDFKFCTVVWYHKMQIKFEFQCDQIIGSKVVTV